MTRRQRWIAYGAIGLALLLIGGGIATRDILRFRQALQGEFQGSCRRRAVTFEEFAERWIVHDQLDSLRGAVKLLLMGDGQYVDIVVRGELLLSEQDEGQNLNPSRTQLEADAMPRVPVIDALPGGDVEVRIPLILAGYPESPIGIIRMGFSGDYVSAQVRSRMMQTGSLGLGAWLVTMGAGAGILVLGRRRQRATRDEDTSHLICGTLDIDTQPCRATLGGIALELTPKLYELLVLFAQRPGVILSDQDILDAVWPDSTYAASPDVKQHIYLLRQALAVAHRDPKSLIVNVKGFGYRLDPPGVEHDLNPN